MDKLSTALLGGYPQLKDPAVVSTAAAAERVELTTETRGIVHVELQVLIRGMSDKAVEFPG